MVYWLDHYTFMNNRVAGLRGVMTSDLVDPPAEKPVYRELEVRTLERTLGPSFGLEKKRRNGYHFQGRQQARKLPNTDSVR